MAERTASAREQLREQASKVDPRYTKGEPHVVATGRNQSEAELIANLLLEEGIPSITRRTRGFDVPDMLAAGPRDLLVAASAVTAAQEVLLQTEMDDGDERYRPSPLQLHAGLFSTVVVVGVVVVAGALIGR